MRLHCIRILTSLHAYPEKKLLIITQMSQEDYKDTFKRITGVDIDLEVATVKDKGITLETGFYATLSKLSPDVNLENKNVDN